jgi:hypothetical protein
MGWEYVIPGYVLVVVALGSYTAATIRRGRALSKHVPADRRRFLDG